MEWQCCFVYGTVSIYHVSNTPKLFFLLLRLLGIAFTVYTRLNKQPVVTESFWEMWTTFLSIKPQFDTINILASMFVGTLVTWNLRDGWRCRCRNFRNVLKLTWTILIKLFYYFLRQAETHITLTIGDKWDDDMKACNSQNMHKFTHKTKCMYV